MNEHVQTAATGDPLFNPLSPEFIRRFTVVGSPDHCTERLIELARCGLDRLVVVGPGYYPDDWGDSSELFVREVVPALRAVLKARTA